MPVIELSSDQINALGRIKNGCIVRGGTGSGKSRTGLAYYYVRYGGQVNTDKYVEMINPPNLYIITTARKRDTLEWEGELTHFYLSTKPELCYYKNLKITVDSWNNIGKYASIEKSFFIFDEQRLVGYGKWVKTFLKIAAHNAWILLTATPGDKWDDYIPVFIANGYYKNKSDFVRRHVVYSRFTNYPKVEKYIDEGRLIKIRDTITVELNYSKLTIPHHYDIVCGYDVSLYNSVVHDRWNIYKNKPIENAGEYCLVLRRIVNSSVDRQLKLLDVVKKHKKVIIFYNHDYELEILRKLFDGHYPYTEWNGHKHQELLQTDHWVYLVQYTAGSEAWNCITTDTVAFYSQSYSYKQMVQAAGRIDRRNTKYIDLYYYHFKSNSKIDGAISKTLKRKKTFSEKNFAPFFEKDAGNPRGNEIRGPYEKVEKSFEVNGGVDAERRIQDVCDEYNSWEHKH